MSRRESNINDQFSIITNATHQSTLLLEGIATTLQQEIFNKLQYKKEEWNQQILNSSKEISKIKNHIVITEEVLSELGKRNRTNENQNQNELTLKDVQGQIQSKIKLFDPENSENVKKIRQIITPEEDVDDELVVVNQGDKESDFLCPFTRKRMNSPILNPTCKHHVSREAFDAMFRSKRSVACPVAGCRATWQKTNATKDTEFQMRLERFFRLQASTVSSQGFDNAVDITQNVDNNYTEIE